MKNDLSNPPTLATRHMGRVGLECISDLGVIFLEAWRDENGAHIGISVSRKRWFGPKNRWGRLDLSSEQINLLMKALKPADH